MVMKGDGGGDQPWDVVVKIDGGPWEYTSTHYE